MFEFLEGAQPQQQPQQQQPQQQPQQQQNRDDIEHHIFHGPVRPGLSIVSSIIQVDFDDQVAHWCQLKQLREFTSEFNPSMTAEINLIQSYIIRDGNDMQLKMHICTRMFTLFLEINQLCQQNRETYFNACRSIVNKEIDVFRSLLNTHVNKIFDIFKHVAIFYNMCLIEAGREINWPSPVPLALPNHDDHHEQALPPPEIVYMPMPMEMLALPTPVEKLCVKPLAAVKLMIAVKNIFADKISVTYDDLLPLVLADAPALREDKTQYIKITFKFNRNINLSTPYLNTLLRGFLAEFLLLALADFLSKTLETPVSELPKSSSSEILKLLKSRESPESPELELYIILVLKIFLEALQHKRVVSIVTAEEFSLLFQTTMNWTETSTRFVNILCLILFRYTISIYPEFDILKNLAANSSFEITPVFSAAPIPLDLVAIHAINLLFQTTDWIRVYAKIFKNLLRESISIDKLIARGFPELLCRFAEGYNLEGLPLPELIKEANCTPLTLELEKMLKLVAFVLVTINLLPKTAESELLFILDKFCSADLNEFFHAQETLLI